EQDRLAQARGERRGVLVVARVAAVDEEGARERPPLLGVERVDEDLRIPYGVHAPSRPGTGQVVRRLHAQFLVPGAAPGTASPVGAASPLRCARAPFWRAMAPSMRPSLVESCSAAAGESTMRHAVRRRPVSVSPPFFGSSMRVTQNSTRNVWPSKASP